MADQQPLLLLPLLLPLLPLLLHLQLLVGAREKNEPRHMSVEQQSNDKQHFTTQQTAKLTIRLKTVQFEKNQPLY